MSGAPSQQANLAPAWQAMQAAGLQAHSNPTNGMQLHQQQQQQQSNQQMYFTATAQQQQQQQQSNAQKYLSATARQQQPAQSGQRAGSAPGAGLALTAELLNSLKSLAPALQQLKQPGT